MKWDNGGKIGNKNKLILIEILPSVQETWYLNVFPCLCLSPGNSRYAVKREKC